MDQLLAIGGDLTSRIGEQIARTSEMTRQKLGNVEDKTELPEDFLLLQQRIKALEKAHARMLKVTSHFNKETYDYPTDLRETFTDMSRTVVGAVNSTVNRGGAAESTGLAGTFTAAQSGPKTFAHALSRAAADSAQMINSASLGYAADNDAGSALADALSQYSEACAQIGNARREQDKAIHDKVTFVWEGLSRTWIRRALEVGNNVESSRLELDAAKSRTKGGLFGMISGKKSNPTSPTGADGEPSMSEEDRLKIEKYEANFNADLSDAEDVMRNALRMADSLQGVRDLVEAQKNFHEKSAQILADLLPKLQDAVDKQNLASTHQRM